MRTPTTTHACSTNERFSSPAPLPQARCAGSLRACLPTCTTPARQPLRRRPHLARRLWVRWPVALGTRQPCLHSAGCHTLSRFQALHATPHGWQACVWVRTQSSGMLNLPSRAPGVQAWPARCAATLLLTCLCRQVSNVTWRLPLSNSWRGSSAELALNQDFICITFSQHSYNFSFCAIQLYPSLLYIARASCL